MGNGESSEDNQRKNKVNQNILSGNPMSEIDSPTDSCISLCNGGETQSYSKRAYWEDQAWIHKIPSCVPLSLLYICSVPNCLFKGSTCDELLKHVENLHKDVNSLWCLFCNKPTKVPLLELNDHLCMHKGCLVTCHYCIYSHYNVVKVVKHCRMSHPGFQVRWDVLRIRDSYPVDVLDSRHRRVSVPYDKTDDLICVTDEEVLTVSDSDVEILDQDKSPQNKDNRLNDDSDVEVVYSKSANSDCSVVEEIEVLNDQLEVNGSRNLDIVEKAPESVRSESTSVCNVPKNGVTYSSPVNRQETDDEYSSDQRIYVSDRVNNLLQKFGKTGHPEGNMFCCPKCNKFKTKVEAEMVDHLYKEIRYYQYVCTYCRRMALSLAKLEDHYRRTHAKHGKFASFAHLKPDAEVEQWTEYVISTQLEIMESFKNFDESVDGSKNGPLCEDKGSVEEFQCKECEEIFFSEYCLSVHLKSFHFQLESWICGHCSFISRSRVDMMEHVNRDHKWIPQSCFQHCMSATAITLDEKFWKEYFRDKDSNFASSTAEVVKESNENRTLDVVKADKLPHESHEKTPFVPLVRLDKNICKKQTLSLGEIEISKENLGKLDTKCVSENEKDKTIDVSDISDESDSYGGKKDGEENCDVNDMSSNFIFICFYCPSLFSELSAARKHWDIAHKMDRAEQSDNEEEFPFKFEKWKENDYLFQLYGAGLNLSYYCSYCMVTDSDLALMMKHISDSHEGCEIKIVFVRPKVYFCVLCLSLMSSFSDILDHFNKNHSVKTLLFEVHCDLVNDFRVNQFEKLHFLKSLLKENPESHDQNISTGCLYEQTKFVCHWCKKSFDDRFSLILHHIGYHWHLVPKHKEESVPHTISNYFKVNFMPCDISFLVINKSAYPCPFCSKKTVLFEDLFYHLFQHVLSFKCCICGYTAGSSVEVHQHSMTAHPSDIPTIVHMRMLDDVLSRLLPQVEGVASVDDRLCDSPSQCRNEISCDKDEAEAISDSVGTNNSEKFSIKPISSYRYSLSSNTRETIDFSKITVLCDLHGMKGRKMTFTELSKHVNIKPYVCMKDCRKSL